VNWLRVDWLFLTDDASSGSERTGNFLASSVTAEYIRKIQCLEVNLLVRTDTSN
jgi:hypothetical protein